MTYDLASDPAGPAGQRARGLQPADHRADQGRRHHRPHHRRRRGDRRRPAGLDPAGPALVIDAPLAYAFGVGMVATVNPCGFAMLPAYLSFFLGLEEADDDTRASVLHALVIGGTVTAGFLVVFGLLGILLDGALSSLQDWLPWVTIVLGFVLVGLGIALLAGRSFALRIPTPRQRGRQPAALGVRVRRVLRPRVAVVHDPAVHRGGGPQLHRRQLRLRRRRLPGLRPGHGRGADRPDRRPGAGQALARAEPAQGAALRLQGVGRAADPGRALRRVLRLVRAAGAQPATPPAEERPRS